jgi:hypothetical protein
MSDQKQNVNSPLFTKDNYTWMLIGGAVIALGMLLMSGGKSADPKVFDTNQKCTAPFALPLRLH